jgi:hypothetical protein
MSSVTSPSAYLTNKYTHNYGFSVSTAIPMNWLIREYHEQCGPSHCSTCRTDGTFEGIYYGLCIKCSELQGKCQCIYCACDNNDGHEHIKRRINIVNFVRNMQEVINDLKRDYPSDELGIVAEAIESGFYILDIHTKFQYEKLYNETYFPEKIQVQPVENNSTLDTPIQIIDRATQFVSEHSSVNFDDIQYSPNKVHTQPHHTIVDISNQHHNIGCVHGDMNGNCIVCAEEAITSYVCFECNGCVSGNDIDDRGYCLDCQNPEYDPVWPKGY